MSNQPSPLFEELSGLLIDLADGGAVTVRGSAFRSARTGRPINVVDGIPNFFVPAEVSPPRGIENATEVVKAFYEETPFQ